MTLNGDRKHDVDRRRRYRGEPALGSPHPELNCHTLVFTLYAEVLNAEIQWKDGQMVPRPELIRRLREAFMDHGYDQINMMGLAKAAELTRRSLYNYFSSKEAVFRYVLDQGNIDAVRAGLAAGRKLLAEGGDTVDIITAVINIRYGETRRRLIRSPHMFELNDLAFRKCRDLMIESAKSFQSELANLFIEMEQHGKLKLRSDVTPADLAQLIADGARGTNQSLPPIESDNLEGRYRTMVKALLYGAVEGP